MRPFLLPLHRWREIPAALRTRALLTNVFAIWGAPLRTKLARLLRPAIVSLRAFAAKILAARLAAVLFSALPAFTAQLFTAALLAPDFLAARFTALRLLALDFAAEPALGLFAALARLFAFAAFLRLFVAGAAAFVTAR